MSQAGIINMAGGGGSGSPVQTLTGNTGGAVPPTANNINVIGAGSITVTGNPGTSTLTITDSDAAPNYVIVTGPTTYVATATDYYISCNSTAGIITVQLPNTTTSSRLFIIKDRAGTSATNAIIVTTVGGVVLIDSVTSYTFTDNFESLELLFNGTFYETF